MINKTIMTAGAFILSMMVLIAATNIDSLEVSEQDRDHHTLSGVVVDADTEEAVTNATVYIKKKNGDDRMQADRTQQQDHQQQQQRDRAAGHDQEGLEQTTTDHNGEFEFDNIGQLLAQGTHGAQQQQQQQQQQHQAGEEDDTFVLVVEAEGYETEEKEIKLSDYIERADRDRGVMERDQDRDRDRDYDRDRDDDKDKDKDKIKIKLTPSN